jgi:L-fucose mutarotase
MLTTGLIHPPLLAALAGAGHGSQVLIADGNFPHSTGANPAAARIHLNLIAGVVDVDTVLVALLGAIVVEAATVMVPPDNALTAAAAGHRTLIGPEATWRQLGRHEFYAATRGPDVAVVIATGDERLYANLLLTIGVRPPAR